MASATIRVRGTGTTVIVDVEQSRGEDVTRAVENIRGVAGEISPAAAGPRSEDAIVLEGDEGVGPVEP